MGYKNWNTVENIKFDHLSKIFFLEEYVKENCQIILSSIWPTIGTIQFLERYLVHRRTLKKKRISINSYSEFVSRENIQIHFEAWAFVQSQWFGQQNL